MAWDITVPVSGTLIVDIPSIFTANWTECENIMGVEHYTYTSSLSGRHKPGITGLLLVDTNANIMALTGMEDGALAYDTTYRVLWQYSTVASGWEQIDTFNRLACDVYRNGDQTVASGTGYTTVQINTATTDPLTAFDTSTYKFTAKGAGYFLICYQITVSPTENGINLHAKIQQDDSSDNSKNIIVTRGYSLSTDDVSIRDEIILGCTAGDKIYLELYHDNSASQVIQGGSDVTSLKIFRLS